MKTFAQSPVAVVGHYIHTLSPDGKPSYRIAYQVSDGPQPEWEGNTARLAACWNACCGLTLPDSAPPGILAEIVEQARRVDTHGRQYGSPGHEAECRALVELLTKLSP